MCQERKKLPRSKEERDAIIREHANRIGVQIISLETATVKSRVVVYCPKCNKINGGTRIDYFINQESVRCCADAKKKVSPVVKLVRLLKSRDHCIEGPPTR